MCLIRREKSIGSHCGDKSYECIKERLKVIGLLSWLAFAIVHWHLINCFVLGVYLIATTSSAGLVGDSFDKAFFKMMRDNCNVSPSTCILCVLCSGGRENIVHGTNVCWLKLVGIGHWHLVNCFVVADDACALFMPIDDRKGIPDLSLEWRTSGYRSHKGQLNYSRIRSSS